MVVFKSIHIRIFLSTVFYVIDQFKEDTSKKFSVQKICEFLFAFCFVKKRKGRNFVAKYPLSYQANNKTNISIKLWYGIMSSCFLHFVIQKEGQSLLFIILDSFDLCLSKFGSANFFQKYSLQILGLSSSIDYIHQKYSLRIRDLVGSENSYFPHHVFPIFSP